MIQTVLWGVFCLALLGGCGDMSSVFKGNTQDMTTFEEPPIPLPSPIDTMRTMFPITARGTAHTNSSQRRTAVCCVK